MQVYLIASDQDRPDLGSRLQAVFGDKFYRVTNSQWLVAANKTPQELSMMAGVNDGQYGRVMLLLVTQYWGWHDQDVWNWISLQAKS